MMWMHRLQRIMISTLSFQGVVGKSDQVIRLVYKNGLEPEQTRQGLHFMVTILAQYHIYQWQFSSHSLPMDFMPCDRCQEMLDNWHPRQPQEEARYLTHHTFSELERVRFYCNICALFWNALEPRQIENLRADPEPKSGLLDLFEEADTFNDLIVNNVTIELLFSPIQCSIEAHKASGN